MMTTRCEKQGGLSGRVARNAKGSIRCLASLSRRLTRPLRNRVLEQQPWKMRVPIARLFVFLKRLKFFLRRLQLGNAVRHFSLRCFEIDYPALQPHEHKEGQRNAR